MTVTLTWNQDNGNDLDRYVFEPDVFEFVQLTNL